MFVILFGDYYTIPHCAHAFTHIDALKCAWTILKLGYDWIEINSIAECTEV